MQRKNGVWCGILAVVTLAVAIFLVSCQGVMPYCTVTFMNGEETVSVGTVLSGGRLQFPEVDIAVGYEAQWLRSDGTVFAPDDTVKVNEVLTLSPKPVEYRVIYNLGGGIAPEGNPDSLTVETEAFDLLPATRGGAAFEGWMDKNGNTVTVLDSSCIDFSDPERTVELTAKWRVTTFSVTYDPAGGSLPDNPFKYTVDDTDTVLKPSVLHGHTFLGWFTESGDKVESFVGQEGELDLTARWEITRFNIVYNGVEKADNSVNPKDFTYLDSVTVTAPVRYGYDFIGWLVGDSEEPVGEYVIPADTVSDITFTAVWRAHPATLTVMLGSEQYAKYDTEFGEIFTLEDIAAPRNGYSLTVFHDPVCGEAVELPYEVDGYAVTVYIFYTPISYSVKLDYGDGSVENYRVFTVESESFTLPVVTREGFTFGGWSDGEHIYGEIAAGSFGNKELTAIWTRNSYSLIFNTMGGKDIPAIEIEYGAKIVFNVTTTRAGMRFGGWYEDEAYVKEFVGGTMPAHSVTLYARWYRNESYTVSYSSDSGTVPLSGSCASGSQIIDGSTVALSAPEYHGGRLFVEWVVNGVSYGKNRDISILIDGDPVNATAVYRTVRGYDYTVGASGLSIPTFSSTAYLDGNGILSSHQRLVAGALNVDGDFLDGLGVGLRVFAMTENSSVSFVYINIVDASPRPSVKVDFDSAFPNVILSCDIPEGQSFVYRVNDGATKPFNGRVEIAGVDRGRVNTFTVSPVGGGESYTKTVSAISSAYREFYNGSFTYGGQTYDLVINSEEELRALIEYVCFVLTVTDQRYDSANGRYYTSLIYIIGEDYATEFNADKAAAYQKIFESMSIPYSPAYTTSSFGDSSPKGKVTVYFNELNTQITDENKTVIPDNAGLLNESTRPEDFESFYIDSLTVTQLVRTLYELEALPFGVRPVFDSSPASQMAKEVYDAAREALRRYVGDHMTDYEKAAAIYDYIGLNVTYDRKLSRVTDNIGAYRGFTSYGALIDGLAVCDGYASAYRIMCLIEGIPCVEVIGTSNGTGHAWNKVLIEGVWYGVDSTWSRVGTSYLTHRYLLVNEAQLIASGHVENGGGEIEPYIDRVASGDKDYYDLNGGVIRNASEIKDIVNSAAADGVTVIELKNLSGKTLDVLFRDYQLSDFNVSRLSYSVIDGTDIVYIIIELK